MPEIQLPFRFYSSGYVDLQDEGNSLVKFFLNLDPDPIDQVLKTIHSGSGPTGYQRSRYLVEILKIKRGIRSYRRLEKELGETDLYRHLVGLNRTVPRHSTWSHFRRTLGVEGFIQIHAGYVRLAYQQGLLEPALSVLPKNRKSGLILIADSTFIRSVSAFRVSRDGVGEVRFADKEAAFGRRHHRYHYALGYRAHTLQTLNGLSLINLVESADVIDQQVIIPLLTEFRRVFPTLPVAYLILDKGYDIEEVHRQVYERFGIIAVIVRKRNIKYPRSFSPNYVPWCKYHFELRKTGIDYRLKRTRYQCLYTCLKQPDEMKKTGAGKCIYLRSRDKKSRGKLVYTYFQKSYRKYGPLSPGTQLYHKLIRLRTAIERAYANVKSNRYRMEENLTVMGKDTVRIQATLHDTVAMLDAITDFKEQRRKSYPTAND